MKTALITGSTSGIGKAIAIKFAEAGYNIVFNGLEENGAEIAKEIAEKYKVDYLFSNANLMFPKQIEELIKAALYKFNTVDILVNNAGIQFVSDIEHFPSEKWDAIIAINLSAPFHLTQAVWSGMKQNNFGRIINISSAHGLVASQNKSAYIASKHGIIGFSKTIALEGAPYNITSNCICPGYVHTPIIDKQIPEQMALNNMTEQEVIDKIMLSKQAVKEFIPAEIIAQFCFMLAQEESKTITGTAIPIDGGWTAE
jgi:3-hydroxybutyrate dehydrogenase